jgi:hypothetical protein
MVAKYLLKNRIFFPVWFYLRESWKDKSDKVEDC